MIKNGDEILLLEAHLAGLYAEAEFIRELAVFQLHGFVSDPKVQLELEKALKRETSAELKKQMQALLGLALLENNKSAPDIQESAGQAKDEIIRNWFSREIDRPQKLLSQLEKLEKTEGRDALVQIISQERELFRLIPLFSTSHHFLKDSEVINALGQKLQAGDSIFLIRLISFLTKNSPGYLIEHIRPLLKHPHFYIRVQALRALFNYSRPHALRLLEELIFSTEESEKSAGQFLFLFPFKDVHNIVFRLIANGALGDEFFRKIIESLVYNNPDLEFFKRLTIIEVLRGDEFSGISDLRAIAAESLRLAGLITEDKESYCQKSLEVAVKFIENATGGTVSLDKFPEMEKPVEDHSEARLNNLYLCEKLAPDDELFIKDLILSSKAERYKTLILKIIGKFQLKHSYIIKWLEENLTRSSSGDLVLVMKLLSELNFSRLLPHLPVLCLNEDRKVGIQAIRLFRKHSVRRLLKQIEDWLKEDNEVSWRSALTALLQIKIEDARVLLLHSFQLTQRVSLIKFFSPVFHISPDYSSLFELEKIMENSKGNKREVIFDQIQLLRNALGVAFEKNKDDSVAKILAESGFKNKWDVFCEGLKEISYNADQQALKDSFSYLLKNNWGKIFIVVLAILITNYWSDIIANSGQSDSLEGQNISKSNQEPPEAEIGSVKFMTLNSYDSINMLWLATSSNGKIYKLKLPNPHDFKAGFKGSFKISHYRVSALGYPIIACELNGTE